MRMHKAKAHKKVLPDNTIPLINIVFLMLIFFLIAGTVAPPISSDLSLAKAHDLEQTPPAANALEIMADGTLVHKGRKLSMEEAIGQFPVSKDDDNRHSAEGGMSEDQREQTLQILADKAVPASKFMPVLQAFRAAGHKTIRLITLREG